MTQASSARKQTANPRRRVLALALSALSALANPAWADEPARLSVEDAARRLASGGFVLMMRHAQTEPGIGDPPGFRLDDCASQRNLSEAGRAQARAIGAAMRAAGVRIDEIRSSAWCRCRETADLAFGRHAVWPALNSFFGDASTESSQTREIEALARRLPPGANVMLVTHQVNVTAAFGSWTSPGQIVAGRWNGARLRAEFSIGTESTPAKPAQ